MNGTTIDTSKYLDIWLLNVGHGDSVVLEHNDGTDRHFAVIDSNCRAGREPPALTKLRERDAKGLSFVALTHPHADHYLGLREILEWYDGSAVDLYTFPLKRYTHGRLKKLAATFRKVCERTDSPTVTRGVEEFVSFLVTAKNAFDGDHWTEPTGPWSVLAPTGFQGVEMAVLSPPSRVRGEWFQQIEHEDLGIVENPKHNELSLAFSVKYGGVQVVLGGDATRSNWLYQKRFYSDRAGVPLLGAAAKLPHHGSKNNCTRDVLEHIFNTEKACIALLSANGRSHPAPETYALLAEMAIQPYCTNLASQCGANIRELMVASELDPVLRRLLNMHLVAGEGENIQPCQGNVLFRIYSCGATEIRTQYEHLCPYRTGVSRIFQ